MKFVNVFAYISQNNIMHVWAKGRQYDTKEEAESFKHILPDVGYVYIKTIRCDKQRLELVLMQE